MEWARLPRIKLRGRGGLVASPKLEVRRRRRRRRPMLEEGHLQRGKSNLREGGVMEAKERSGFLLLFFSGEATLG